MNQRKILKFISVVFLALSLSFFEWISSYSVIFPYVFTFFVVSSVVFFVIFHILKQGVGN